MKVHPVFHIGLLKEYNSSPRRSEIPDDIPSSNDIIYGDDAFQVHSMIDHNIAPRPQTYAKAQLFYLKSNKKDTTLSKTLGNHIYKC